MSQNLHSDCAETHSFRRYQQKQFCRSSRPKSANLEFLRKFRVRSLSRLYIRPARTWRVPFCRASVTSLCTIDLGHRCCVLERNSYFFGTFLNNKRTIFWVCTKDFGRFCGFGSKSKPAFPMTFLITWMGVYSKIHIRTKVRHGLRVYGTIIVTFISVLTPRQICITPLVRCSKSAKEIFLNIYRRNFSCSF